ncbi:hypothetical protein JW826_03180 [Candidatus Woesearchaeota archaeon]|nr:hypothetical protein [Candidatus Woesearchaeota archaeon]
MRLNDAFKTGISFGLTSGTITTLGLMVGLSSASHSASIVIGGVLTLALADSFSDALGIHISAESRKESSRSVWEATIATFLTKIIYTCTYLIPVLLFQLPLGIYVGVAWGLVVITTLSFLIAKAQKESAWRVIGEHLFITIVVILLSNYIGGWIADVFGS